MTIKIDINERDLTPLLQALQPWVDEQIRAAGLDPAAAPSPADDAFPRTIELRSKLAAVFLITSGQMLGFLPLDAFFQFLPTAGQLLVASWNAEHDRIHGTTSKIVAGDSAEELEAELEARLNPSIH
jgi:hypothetical protein